MGDYFVRLMPREAEWVPHETSDVDGACDLLKRDYALHNGVAEKLSQNVEFYVSLEELDRVNCPRCGRPLYYAVKGGDSDGRGQEEVWMQWMVDASNDGAFHDLSVVTPCCSLMTSLNDLHYSLFSAGFCRWHIEVDRPGASRFSPGLIEKVEEMLGTDLKVVHHRI